MVRLSQFSPVISARLAGSLVLLVLVTHAARAADGPVAAKEKELIDVLRSGQPAEKAVACKHLATQGSGACVPELAKLLADEQLSSWARIALEAIPDRAADEALRTALGALQGRLAIGAINSIAVRRDADAVPLLSGRMQDAQADVASAAAVALGKIGGAAATSSLRSALPSAAPPVRNAVAEGCILGAERLLAEGQSAAALELYELVRQADVPKQRKLEATRGAIFARGQSGVVLLVEQLRSSDKSFQQLGLTVARELPGQHVAEALAAELGHTPPGKAALLLGALADRPDFQVTADVLKAAQSGPKELRLAAIAVAGKAGDAATLAPLLEMAADNDADIAQAAQTALASLGDERINSEILARLPSARGTALRTLIELIGIRRISATPSLVKSLEQPDAAIRGAALAALGETIGAADLPVLINQIVTPRVAEDLPAAQKALRAAAIRMPNREACAAELASAMPRASVANQTLLLEILGAMGGPKALETIGQAMKHGPPELQDAGSRVLGEWMNVDAAPVLLDLAKSAKSDKFQVRALRGYIRLARQFSMPDAQRAQMCENALKTSERNEEQKLVLAVLERYPSVETLRVAAGAARESNVKDEAKHTAQTIAYKLSGKVDGLPRLLAEVGIEPIRVEILSAEYGAGAVQKNVADVLRQHVREASVVVLSGGYNEAFGGDPVPNTPKTLKVRYRINGKEGEASFAENAAISLPIPK